MWRPQTHTVAFVVSVLCASVGGSAVLVGTLAFLSLPRLSGLPMLLLALLAYTLTAAPFVAIGLALFGLPLARLLRPHAYRGWMAPVVILCGAAAGIVAFYAFERLVFLRGDRLAGATLADPGVIYGVAAALAWWLIDRAVPARGASASVSGTEPSSEDRRPAP